MLVPQRPQLADEVAKAKTRRLVTCLKTNIRDIVGRRNGDTAADYSNSDVTNPQMELASWIRNDDGVRAVVTRRFPYVDWQDFYNEDEQVILEVASFLLTIYG